MLTYLVCRYYTTVHCLKFALLYELQASKLSGRNNTTINFKHFDGKQSRDPVDLPSTCHLSPGLTTFGFRSREVKRFLLVLDSYGGTDPLGMFPLFLKKIAVVLAPCLAVVFQQLLCLGSFPVCWRMANVTPIPKGPPSSPATNYRPISFN